jgi:hypothetical protein
MFCAGCAAHSDVDMTTTMNTGVDAHVGRTITSDSTKVDDITAKFAPNQTVYAVIDVPGKKEGILRVRWAYGAETVQEVSRPLQTEANAYPFRLDPPEGGFRLGDYELEVFINENRVEMEKFKVATD